MEKDGHHCRAVLFFAYATYDLTNLATLKQSPIGLSLLNMCWGILVSTVAATAGKIVLDPFVLLPE